MKADEVERLMRLIAEKGHGTSVVNQTKDELEAIFGPKVAAHILGGRPLAENFEGVDAYVCTVIRPGEMLTLPDNVVGLCAWGCGRTIQFRPWAPSNIPKVCLYCCAERAKDDN